MVPWRIVFALFSLWISLFGNLSVSLDYRIVLTPEKAEKQYLIRKRLKSREIDSSKAATSSLLQFTAYTNTKYEANWHHMVLCAYLDAFAEGKIKRLMVFMPPRHGKSELVSRRLPPYILGRNPNEKIVVASYAASLASSMCLDAQGIMDSQEYKTVFPNAKLLQKGMTFDGRTPKRTSDFVEIATPDYSGYLKSVGVGGGLTGFGFSRGIIDDPFKNREEADSETTREAVYKWYTSTFLTRQNSKDSGICLLLTRWHEDDLAGRLLSLAERDPDADQWTVLSMPAEFEEPTKEFPTNRNDKRKVGEALWPSKYPTSFLKTLKQSDPRDWAALYQQRPYTEGGAILKKQYWRFYKRHELPKFLDEQILSVDCTFKDLKTSDFVAIQVWGRKGADKYLIDQYKDRMDFVSTCDAILSMVQKYPKARTKLVEDKANGTAVMNSMKRRISGFLPVEPDGGKVARAQAVAPQCCSGNVWLPNPDQADWVSDFIDECAKFPNGKHDDQVDACTQALNHLEASEGIDIRALTRWE